MQNVRWYGDRWKAAMRSEARKRNSAGAIAVFNRAKILTSHEGAGARVKAVAKWKKSPTIVVQNRGTRKQIGKLVYGAFPSAPGDPPHKQTGRGSGSIAWENVSDTIARIGTNVRYFGRWVEGGTRKMAARPWLRRALREMTPFIRAVWARPWRGPGV
jgi:hypothetical protein